MIKGHSNYWKEELTAFMSQMKKAEHVQFEEISAIQQGITKWFSFCTTQNKLGQVNIPKNSTVWTFCRRGHVCVYSLNPALSLSVSRCPDQNHEKTSVEKIHADLKQWLNVRYHILLPVSVSVLFMSAGNFIYLILYFFHLCH